MGKKAPLVIIVAILFQRSCRGTSHFIPLTSPTFGNAFGVIYGAVPRDTRKGGEEERQAQLGKGKSKM